MTPLVGYDTDTTVVEASARLPPFPSVTVPLLGFHVVALDTDGTRSLPVGLGPERDVCDELV